MGREVQSVRRARQLATTDEIYCRGQSGQDTMKQEYGHGSCPFPEVTVHAARTSRIRQAGGGRREVVKFGTCNETWRRAHCKGVFISHFEGASEVTITPAGISIAVPNGVQTTKGGRGDT